MNVIVFDSQAFEALKGEFRKYVREALLEVLSQKTSNEQSDWISPSEAKKLLPFKSNTSWQKLRDGGELTFSQFGRKIMYSRTSINEYLIKNKIDY